MKNPVWILLLCVGLGSCSGSADKKYNDDTATSGSITIAADESLQPIVDAEIEVFQSIYPEAHIRVIYTNEYDAIDLMCKDSARLAIVTRGLLPEERVAFERDQITPRFSPFAYDAIAILLNRNINDTIFTPEQVAGILSGEIKTWNDINPASAAVPMRVIFDSPKSGITRYCKDSLLQGKELGKQCYAVDGNRKVIDEVEKDPNTIGLIGVTWISDQDDSLSRGFIHRIRVANIVARQPAESATMKPFQAYIALKQYPFWREVQIISREARVGLGTGFASFIASDKGQRIVLKSGLVPAKAPVRIIQINNKNL